MNLKQITIYSIFLIVGTAALTRYLWPSIQTQIKIEEKEVVRNDVRTIIKERTKSDGTKETETEIIDRTIKEKDKHYTAITTKKKDWFIAGGASINPNDVRPVYNLQVNRRIIGPFYLGASVNTRKDVGLQIGAEF